MDELEKNIPDDFWRKAFDEAVETPPTRVWDTIERRLEESNKPKIIPLWGSGLASSQPLIWGGGIAAALALLVVGWWAINTQSANQPAAQLQPSRPTGNITLSPATPTNSALHKSPEQSDEAIAFTGKPSEKSARSLAVSTRQPPEQSVGGLVEVPIRQPMAQPSLEANPSGLQPTMETPLPAFSGVLTTATALPTTERTAVVSFTAGRNVAAEAVMTKQAGEVTYEQLRGKALRLRSLGSIQRIVWFQPAGLPMEAEFTKEKRKARAKWASASVMPGAFNPMVSIPSVQTGSATAFVASASKTNSSAISSRASFSVAYQAGAGVQLTDRWSVESGIGYLAGHSTVEAPAQLVTYNSVQGISVDQTSTVNNLYVDALRNSSSNRMVSNAAASSTSLDLLTTNNAYLSQSKYSNQTQQTLTNDYQYMQVPIQVGYQLRSRKRLSLAVLGGLLTNIFVRNTVSNAVVITGKDGVYRPVSLAAIMGARFRYRSSGRWSASLAGLYQPSLESGTQPDSQVQSHPTSAGMSFGVDYHF